MINEDPFMLTSLSSRCTGLDGTIWVKCDDSEGKDSPYLLYQKGDSDIGDSVRIPLQGDCGEAVSEGLPGNVLKDISHWIEANREALLLHWKGEIDSADLVEKIISNR